MKLETTRNSLVSGEESVRKPFPRSYWVVPGALCAGAYPGDPDTGVGQQKLAALLDLGICHVVNLMENLCTTLRAFYQRKKGRDLYELWHTSTAVDINP